MNKNFYENSANTAVVSFGPSILLGENYYVTKTGEVYRKGSNKPLKGTPDSKGYLKVKLYDLYSKPHTKRIHRIVLESFTRKWLKPCMDNASIGPDIQVDHINGIVDDNRLENLRWVTNDVNAANRASSYHLWDKGFKDKICSLYFEKHKSIIEITNVVRKSRPTISAFLRGHILPGEAEAWCVKNNVPYYIRTTTEIIK